MSAGMGSPLNYFNPALHNTRNGRPVEFLDDAEMGEFVNLDVFAHDVQ
jgi:hypothetical protein